MFSEKLKFYNNWCEEHGIKSTLNGYLSFCERLKKLDEKYGED